MSHLYVDDEYQIQYIDKKLNLSKEEYMQRIYQTTTVYVGNLSIYTPEEYLFELFSQCGKVHMIKMGINRNQGTPIGFCFVVFHTHQAAKVAVNCLSKTKLDNRIIRVDWDVGFEEGRQFGRGKGGIQRRDQFRKTEDPDRPFFKPHQQGYKKVKTEHHNHKVIYFLIEKLRP